MSQKTEYVCGFLFCRYGHTTRVLLIEKKRPRWQAGKLNGIGGHIEPGETPLAAMRREFLEEAGVAVPGWQPAAVLTGDEFVVHFFSSWVAREVFEATTAMTDEPLRDLDVADIWFSPVVPNLLVMIPLAADQSGIVKPVWLTDAVPVAA
jgi:8-oxo-dGTP diphosphatase